MENFKRTFSFLLSLTIIFGLSSLLNAQNPSAADVDSTFEKYMDKAWDKLRESNVSDSLQNVYAKEFFVYYQQNPKTKTGKEALSQAFMMWGNTGNARYLNKALETLDYDSEIWGKIINSLRNIYYRNESLEKESYEKLLIELKNKLTDPISKSAVIWDLLRKAKAENKKQEAITLARQLVEINAADFFVERGLGYLREFKSLNIGQKAPNFSTQTIYEENISLSELHGQYILLDFWATWCSPCLPEIQYLKTLWNQYGGANLKIIGISLDRKKSDLTEYMDEKEIDWPHILENGDFEGKITKMYNVVGIPRTYLINPEGIIVAKDLRGKKMIKKVEEYLNK